MQMMRVDDRRTISFAGPCPRGAGAAAVRARRVERQVRQGLRTPLLLVSMICCLPANQLWANDEPDTAAAARHFEKTIRPILVTRCLKCHGDRKQEGGLRLDSRAAVLRGGESGPAIIPGKAAGSLLLAAIQYRDLEMPPDNRLSDKQVREFERWIAGGAVWPQSSDTLRRSSSPLTEADRSWWAFLPLRDVPVPGAGDVNGRSHPIDGFIDAALRREGLAAGPLADKTTLVRRLYFDLIGVPPTPEETDAFVNDASPQAWKSLIDRLLDDPRYGEHWARFWLDLVRFSESDGWNQDAFRPHIWRYRDYVVRSFNQDKPYDEFVRQQLAGDEMDRSRPENLEAAGFLRLGVYEYNQRDARGHWNDIMNEMTDVVADVFLGMGVACARCHDHKFDPILQSDYFQLRAFFEPVVWRDDLHAASVAEREAHARQHAEWLQATSGVRAEIDRLLEPYHARKWKSTVGKFPLDIQACFHKTEAQRTSWEHQMAYLVGRQFQEEGGGPLKSLSKQDQQKHAELLKQLAGFDDRKAPPLPRVMTVTDFGGRIAPTRIPQGETAVEVEPAFPAVLAVGGSSSPDIRPVDRSSGRRTALANWIGHSDNALTMRVIVNRIWQAHFGRGLVATPNDFGRKGQRPTHPELLDWLTTRFVEGGLTFKRLHRLMLTSAAWRRSVQHPRQDAYRVLDPGDVFLWRSSIRRLRAEQIRDAMLSVSGELSNKVGGPSVSAKNPRRALYVKSFRNTPDAMMYAFDVAKGLKSVAGRNNTTTPTQALLMINGDYVLDRARALAKRLESGDRPLPDALRYGFRLAWGRLPDEMEWQRSLEFVTAGDPAPEQLHERLVDFCHVLLNSNEFLYLD